MKEIIIFNIEKYLKQFGVVFGMEPEKRGRGRPTTSKIRDNMIELLYFMKSAYGYELYKAYRKIFPAVTMRSIYYHLKKGTQLGVFEVDKVERSKGEYSWGPEAEKIYYKLTQDAKPKADSNVKKQFESLQNTKSLNKSKEQ